jgi:hypothetical protein
VTKALKKSSVRYGAREFTLLRELGLCERQPDTIFHRLTDDGKGWASRVALRIAKELGIHETYSDIRSYKYQITHCTCGARWRLYSGKLSEARWHHERVQKHLNEVASGKGKTEAT